MNLKLGFPVCFGYNLIVLAVIAILAVALGLWNNSRVYEEQRVPLFGDVAAGVEE